MMQIPDGIAGDAQGAESLAVLKGWLDAAMSGKAMEAKPHFWNDDAVISLPTSLPFGGEYAHDNAGEYHGKMRDLLEVRPGPPQLFGAGDKVFLVGALVGTAKQTGKPVNASLIEVFTIRGGKIARDDFYFQDTAALIDALTE
jgi:ketosteroid isomerase-like protein